MSAIMSGHAAKSIDELPTLWDGFAKLVRPGLKITAFGANIMDLPPNYSTAPHDEADSGQQELYVALRGSGSVDIDGERLPLDADHLVKVDPPRIACWRARRKPASSDPGEIRARRRPFVLRASRAAGSRVCRRSTGCGAWRRAVR
jgi:hypothetical protein